MRNLKIAQLVQPVYDMQKAILAFKEEAQKHVMFTMDAESAGGQAKKSINPGAKGNVPGFGAQDVPESPDQLEGYKHFNDYIISNYLNKKIQPGGKAYVDVDVESPTRSAAGASEVKNLSSMIDSIGRVGTPTAGGGKGERFVDGVWGPRTSNSLHLICDVVRMLSLFLKDAGYSKISLNEIARLESLIPPNETPYKSMKVADLQQRASEITPILQKAKSFISGFQKEIDTTNVDQYASQKNALMPIGKTFAKPTQHPAFEALKNEKIKAKLGDKEITLSFDDLSSLEKFKAAVSKVDSAWADPNYLGQAYNSIKSTVG